MKALPNTTLRSQNSDSQPSLIWLAVAFACAMLSGSAFAQSTSDEENSLNASRDLRRILNERRELRYELEALERQTVQIKQRIKGLDRLVETQKALDDLIQRVEQAEADRDEERLKRLESELTPLKHQLDYLRDLQRIDDQLGEVKELVQRLEGIDDDDDARHSASYLEKTIDRLDRLREIRVKLNALDENATDSARDALEHQADKLEDRIEADGEFMELIVRAVEALENDREDESEELKIAIRTLRRQLEQPSVTSANALNNKPAVVDDSLLPVVVNATTLAPFANADFDNTVVPILRSHCIDCHGDDSSSGTLNIQRIISERPLVINRDKWINIIEQCKNRVMPPMDVQALSDNDRNTLVLSLHHTIYNFDYSQVSDPGFVPARRLTHQEYDNTIRALFGVDLKLAQHFPTDMTGTSGFDNSANTLFIQPLLMERYIGAAETVISTLLPEHPQSEQEKTAHASICFETPQSPEQETVVAAKVLDKFLHRAYRRSVSEREVQRVNALYEASKTQGLSHHSALTGVLQAILISPHFLLKNESDPPAKAKEQAYRISDCDLANRLSYFLWSSMPDETLLQLAVTGELSTPEILHQQVDRMIDDSRSMSLGTNFAAQWLGSQHLGTRMRMDPIDNPWCTDSLMAAMRAETELFIHTLIRENQPIPRLIDADFTFLNRELADLYGIPGIRGDKMQRVSIDPERRGGIFGQGSLLAVTSFPYRTSPVVRGKWILDTVLGTPPPPPPPNVSQFPDEIAENERLTIKQKLELHRKAPNCYACHSQMDPLGLSLENYDWFGRWRDRYGRKKIDNKGKLPDGSEFQGLAGLKRVILEERSDDLIRQVTSKILGYALGRQLEYYDEPAIRSVLAKLAKDESRFRSLIHHVVDSYPFQYKKQRVNASNSEEINEHE